MLETPWEEVEYRFDECRATNMAHIEIYEMVKILINLPLNAYINLILI